MNTVFKRILAFGSCCSVLCGSLFLAAPAAEKKQLSVYFANWACYTDAHQKQTVDMLPWDRLTTINHAFWKITPNGNSYTIASSDSWSDIEMGNSHFGNYAKYHAMYPDVNIMLSVGGWTLSNAFSPMAMTEAGRASFIQSCIDTMNKYPFFAGIDIDWEYPGVTRDECGSDPKDGANYTSLLKEMRAAFDKAYGAGKKRITVCAPANNSDIIADNGQVNQNLKEISKYVDMINIMTYDLAGTFDPVTGYQTNLYPSTKFSTFSTDDSVKFFIKQGVPAAKICIGAPLYSRGWANVSAADANSAVGKSGNGGEAVRGTIDGGEIGGQNPWFLIKEYELSSSFSKGYDKTAEAAYIYCNDKNSKYYGNFYTYENETSLAAKLDYINSKNLGGMIVWEASGDSISGGYPMLSQMAKALGISSKAPLPYTPPAYSPSSSESGGFDDGQWHGDDSGDYSGTTIYDSDTYMDGASTVYRANGNSLPSGGIPNGAYLTDGAMLYRALADVESGTIADNSGKLATLGRLLVWEEHVGNWDALFDGEFLLYKGDVYQLANGGNDLPQDDGSTRKGTELFDVNRSPDTTWALPVYTFIASVISPNNNNAPNPAGEVSSDGDDTALTTPAADLSGDETTIDEANAESGGDIDTEAPILSDKTRKAAYAGGIIGALIIIGVGLFFGVKRSK
ncbi:MAG: glycoside hydrolase family 18 protein [Oscillospiraceae bacterium]|jgi:chitinase|nr:glycoside hydrolase family 18 protein [Oscillospiraceae bacterium]